MLNDLHQAEITMAAVSRLRWTWNTANT